MPAKISVASVIEKNRLSSDVAYLAMLEIDVPDPATGTILETLRYVNNTENVVRNGNTYEAVQFSLDVKAELGAMPSVSLSFYDYAQHVLSKMKDNQGGVGFKVTITVVSATNLDGDPEVAEYFEVTDASAANYVVQFTLGAENALTRQFPRRIQRRDFCQWIYRDANTCRYSGSINGCDHTLDGPNGCRAHQNTENFGGCPNLVPSGSLYL
ncbi:hypothetical protein [Paraburkholderia sp.]|uniref:hypothetical protein n=1 Tax=Paraburkholderia sp. TaxID=1926495 RepID=UPI0039E3F30B